MYIEIDRSQFSLVSPLLGVPTYLSLYSIINGKSSGRVWVNNTPSTSSAFVWDLTNGFVFVLGKPNSRINFREMNLFLREELVPTARKLGYARLNTILLFDHTNAETCELLERLSANTEEMLHFRLEGNDKQRVQNTDVPHGFELVMIDEDVLSNTKLANIEEIGRCITACWQDLGRYFKEGIGFVILRENAAVSWCSTDYVVSGKCDLYVETVETCRQKGFGTIVTSACVKECLNRRLEINWHCWQQNIGSIRLARKIGFSQRPNLTVYAISL